MTAIEVLGDRETVLAFRLGGVPGRIVRSAEEARAALDAAVAAARQGGGPGRRFALLLVTRGAAERIRADLDRALLDPTGPLVIEIPGLGEPAGQRPVERFVERVLGMHL
jgi:vacuolar-type H+-ATPase subunit F/Vma7